MTEQDSQNTVHEETIVPVKPGIARVEVRPAEAEPRKSGSRYLVVGGLAVTLLAALGVVFLLPVLVEDSEPVTDASPEPEAVVEENVEPAGPALTAEEIEVLRAEAEALLADLLRQQATLAALSASSWGEAVWERYDELSRAGDDAYLANEFQDAVPAYAEALEVGGVLLARSDELIAAAISAGTAALEAGNARLATEQFELVVGIRADHAEGMTGLARAQVLPQVLVLVQQGDQLERDGELQAAADAYREALALDSAWEPARAALNAVNQRIANRNFDSLMSRGLAALATEDYGEAAEIFTQALAMRPRSAEAQNGRTQAEQGAALDRIALAEARGIAAETVERWDRAIGIYRELLAEDPSLAFAQAGLQRSLLRADLEAKLLNLIDNPTLLFNDQVLQDAGALLDEARAVENIGARLEQQIADLDRIVRLASTPLTVELRSDEQTSVNLYRVGQLGTFAKTQVELRPGNYRAQGTRNGYRDVLVDIVVRPGVDMAPVEIVCVDPI
ncbi:MAG TPA: hypothetical protein VIV14_02205 [Gammaproteobacteria bacterium]